MDVQDARLNDFVKRNDRQSAANLIEKYLPWPLMEPIEVRFWQQWLESIRKPDFKNSIVLLRGVGAEDPAQIQVNKDGTINLGYFSPVLTKNQGSYNRRLRSITTKRFSSNNYEKELPMMSFHQLIDDHARAPLGSYFLSTTFSKDTVAAFAEEGLLTLKVDPRRVIFNKMGYDSEKEVLVPLIIFPDEVKGYFPKSSSDHYNVLIDEVNKGIKKSLTKDEQNQLEKNGKLNFMNTSLKEWRKILKEFNQVTQMRCERIFGN